MPGGHPLIDGLENARDDLYISRIAGHVLGTGTGGTRRRRGGALPSRLCSPSGRIQLLHRPPGRSLTGSGVRHRLWWRPMTVARIRALLFLYKCRHRGCAAQLFERTLVARISGRANGRLSMQTSTRADVTAGTDDGVLQVGSRTNCGARPDNAILKESPAFHDAIVADDDVSF